MKIVYKSESLAIVSISGYRNIADKNTIDGIGVQPGPGESVLVVYDFVDTDRIFKMIDEGKELALIEENGILKVIEKVA